MQHSKCCCELGTNPSSLHFKSVDFKSVEQIQTVSSKFGTLSAAMRPTRSASPRGRAVVRSSCSFCFISRMYEYSSGERSVVYTENFFHIRIGKMSRSGEQNSRNQLSGERRMTAYATKVSLGKAVALRTKLFHILMGGNFAPHFNLFCRRSYSNFRFSDFSSSTLRH